MNVVIEEDEHKYGIPQQKKFPMPDAKHVRSAIRFFNYVTPKYEEQLAKAILKRMKEYGLTFDDFTVGDENRFKKYIPETALEHHGIKGQRWGIRRYQNEDGTLTNAGKKRYSSEIKTSTGEVLKLNEAEPGKIANFLRNHGDRIRSEQDKSIDIRLTDKNDKKIGNLFLYNEGNDSLNVNWLDVDEKQRGKGYGTAAMKAAINYAKDNGYKQVTLEVPGDSPDARHIYEKLGFKETEKLSEDSDVWGGLTAMTLKLDELKHHGIKGQRWGIRRYQNEDGSLTERGKKHYKRLDDKWIDRKANKIEAKAYRQSQREMKKVTKQLNRKYRLSPNSAKAGRKYMNEYNQNLARIMNTKVSDIRSPSGRSVKFIAKRGDYGVMMALADEGYDMNKVKSGIWEDGRVAYKTEKVEKRK